MRHFLRPALAGALGILGGAAGCDQSAPTSTQDTSLSVTVAPLDLPNMTDACYGLTVFNTTDPSGFNADTQVWTQADLCASQYGADGGIRFTGICDAQAAGATHDNAVRLVLNNVYANGDHTSGTALASGNDFVNPCPPPTEGQPDNGCVLTAPCTENQDSKIVFNLTIMRNANLGFFDTVVKFSDIFCAAKTDCVEDDGTTTLTYLHDPNTNTDGPTAVVAFACTGGADAAATYMYLNDVVVTCTDGRTATVDPSAGPGNVTATESNTTTPILFGAAVNRGDGAQQGTAYWNVLLGMNLDAASGVTCTLTTSGTASDVALAGGDTPEHTRYPIVEWNVELSSGADRTCTRHALNGGNGVATAYTTISTPATFVYQMARLDGGNAGPILPPAGTFVSLTPTFGAGVTPQGSPRAIAADTAGNAWACNAGIFFTTTAVYKVAPSGALTAYATTSECVGVAADDNGNVWVAERGGVPPVLDRFAADGSRTQIPIVATAENIGTLGAGVRVAPNGEVWVPIRQGSVNGTSRVSRFSNAGQLLATYTTCYFPIDVSFDGAGNAWVSCLDGGAISRVNPTSGVVDTFGNDQGVGTGVWSGGFGFFLPGYDWQGGIERLDPATGTWSRAPGGGQIFKAPNGNIWTLGAGGLIEYDTNLQQVRTVAVADGIGGAAYDATNDRIWLTHPGTDSASYISSPGGVPTVNRISNIGHEPVGIALRGSSSVWIALQNGSSSQGYITQLAR